MKKKRKKKKEKKKRPTKQNKIHEQTCTCTCYQRYELKDKAKKGEHVYMLQNEAYICIQKYDNKSIPRSNKVNNNTNENEKREKKVDDSQLDMISTWKQWLYIGYIVSVLYIGYIVSVDKVDIQSSY